jgi:hypothetical protein
MTVFGKLLAVLNLVVGIGLAMWSVNLYTNRPSWFDEPSDVVDKGNSPITFKQLKTEIDSLSKSATSLSGKWGTGLTQVEQLEVTRKDRQGKQAARLVLARTGTNANKTFAFTELVVEPGTGLTDLSQTGAVVVGPPPPGEAAGLPLRGSETLLATANKDVAASTQVADQSKKLRLQERVLAAEIGATEVRYLKQTDIRENLTNEYLFLSAFEVSVYEDRETVFKRKAQLQRRLATFGPTGN